jgi:hypothetical protein
LIKWPTASMNSRHILPATKDESVHIALVDQLV